MRILIVEDDQDKRRQLADFFRVNIGAEIDEAFSRQSGLQAIVSNSHDLILLDMSMPTYDLTPSESGGRPQPYAGRELLQQMARREIDTKVIVVTAFDQFGNAGEELTLSELNGQLARSFPNLYLGAVFYSVTYTGWQEGLTEILRVAGIYPENK